MAEWEDAPSASNTSNAWEDAPWEDSPESQGFLSSLASGAAQFGRDAGGAALGVADLGLGAISSTVGALKAAGQMALGGNQQEAFDEYRQVAGDNLGSALSKFGMGDPRENPGYKNIMKPFELISEGTDWVADQAGLGPAGRLALDVGTMAAPIPGLKAAGRGFGRLAEAVDPALRGNDYVKPADLPGYADSIREREAATVAEQTARQEAEAMQREQWAYPDEQGDMMGVINPYDVGGNVTAFNEGRTTQIDPFQPELGGRIEDVTSVPEQIHQEVLRQIQEEVNANQMRDFTENARQIEIDTQQNPQLDMFGNFELGNDAGVGMGFEPSQRQLETGTVPQSAYTVTAARDAIANPPEVTQQFRDAAEGVPGLSTIEDRPVLEATPDKATQAMSPVDRVVENVPGLDGNAAIFDYGDVNPQSILQKAMNETDGGTGKYNVSGSNFKALINRSSLVRGASAIMNRAENATRNVTLRRIVPMEKAMQKLTTPERNALASVLKSEMLDRKVLTDAELVMQPPKVREAYKKFREEDAYALERTNQAREVAGLKPITGQDFHVASRWRGNFKAEVRGADGKLLYMLREPSRRALNRSKEALSSKMQGLQIKDMPEGRRSRADSDSFEAGYNDMLAFLDDGDPRVQQLKSVYEDYQAMQGTSSLGQTLHAENKANVRGFMGDRPHVSEAVNAKDMLTAQVDYIRNAHKWANQQEAVAGIKQLVSDPAIREKQPNNVEYINRYTKNAIGFGTNEHIRGIEDGIARGLGYDRSAVMNGLNHLRSYFYTKNLGLLNPKAMAVQIVQPAYIIPALLDMQSMGVKINPVKMAADTVSDFWHLTGGEKGRAKMSQTSQGAIKYAVDNGILDINVLDDTREIGASGTLERTKNILNLNQTLAEKFTRATTYMMFTHALENAGLKGENLYRSAEAATNRVAVDYRKFEQPMWMESGGILGRSAGTLKNFMQNNLNQLYYYSQQAKRGKPQGLAAFMGLQFALGGALGMYGIGTISDIYDEYLKPQMPAKYRDGSIKATALENMPDWFNYGLVSKATGMNLAGSFSMADLVQMDGAVANVAPFMTDIAKTIGATAKAAMDPTNKEKLASALYENLPPQGKGIMENMYPGFTSANGTSVNPRDPSVGMYKRDDFDSAVRYLGATSLKEASTKEKAYIARQREFQINEAKQSVREGYVQAQRQGDQEKMKEAIQTLSKWMGPDELANYLTQGVIQAVQTQNQDVWQRQTPKSLNNSSQIMQYQRQQGLRNSGEDKVLPHGDTPFDRRRAYEQSLPKRTANDIAARGFTDETSRDKWYMDHFREYQAKLVAADKGRGKTNEFTKQYPTIQSYLTEKAPEDFEAYLDSRRLQGITDRELAVVGDTPFSLVDSGSTMGYVYETGGDRMFLNRYSSSPNTAVHEGEHLRQIAAEKNGEFKPELLEETFKFLAANQKDKRLRGVFTASNAFDEPREVLANIVAYEAGLPKGKGLKDSGLYDLIAEKQGKEVADKVMANIFRNTLYGLDSLFEGEAPPPVEKPKRRSAEERNKPYAQQFKTYLEELLK